MKKIIRKVALLGSKGVGKSTIIGEERRMFKIDTRLVGAEYFLWNPSEEVKLQVWEMDPSEKQTTLRKMYYQGTTISLLVYDVTDRESFAIMQSLHKELESCIEERILHFVIANKTDITDGVEVTSTEGLEFSRNIGAHFLETNRNELESLFQQMEEIVFAHLRSEGYKLS